MNHAESLAWLDHVQGKGIKMGLEKVTLLLDALGRPQEAFPSILVGGTNGKGSVCAFIASILERAGYRTGLYTSPHLVRYEERIAVHRRPVSEQEFAAAITDVRHAVARSGAREGTTAHPTHFECLTAAALGHFRRSGVEVAVVEVGMGGRLDATRVVRAPVAVITSIGLEHTRFLGGTLEAIAAEKAGIIEPANDSRRPQRVVSGVVEGPAAEVIRTRAERCGALLAETGRDCSIEPAGARITIGTSRARYAGVRLPLAGRHQHVNASLAVLAAEAFDDAMRATPDGASALAAHPLEPSQVVAGLEGALWPGRLQIISREPLTILDGAHNPAGCAALAEAIEDLRAEGALRRVCLVVGVLEDKDAAAMLRHLVPTAQRVVLTRGASPRFLDPGALATAWPAGHPGPVVHRDLGKAIEDARSWCGAGDAVIVCGSLYLVGDAMQACGVDPFEARGGAIGAP